MGGVLLGRGVFAHAGTVEWVESIFWDVCVGKRVISIPLVWTDAFVDGSRSWFRFP